MGSLAAQTGLAAALHDLQLLCCYSNPEAEHARVHALQVDLVEQRLQSRLGLLLFLCCCGRPLSRSPYAMPCLLRRSRGSGPCGTLPLLLSFTSRHPASLLIFFEGLSCSFSVLWLQAVLPLACLLLLADWCAAGQRGRYMLRECAKGLLPLRQLLMRMPLLLQ